MDRVALILGEGTSLEGSGVNPLLALAQELGVRGAKKVVRPEATRREIAEPSLGRNRGGSRHEDAGFKVSLSETASRLAEGLSTESATPANSLTRRETDMTDSSPEAGPSDPARPRPGRGYGVVRRNAGIAAYERNARTIPGERVRVIA